MIGYNHWHEIKILVDDNNFDIKLIRLTSMNVPLVSFSCNQWLAIWSGQCVIFHRVTDDHRTSGSISM